MIVLEVSPENLSFTILTIIKIFLSEQENFDNLEAYVGTFWVNRSHERVILLVSYFTIPLSQNLTI